MSKNLFLPVVLIAAVAGLGQTTPHGGSDGNPPIAMIGGNAAAGKMVFDGSGNCLSCHRAGARGSVLGPNLSDVGSRLPSDDMKHLLMEPPSKVDPQNRLYEIELVTGKTVRGKLLNQDPFSLQMLDSDGQLVAYTRSQVRDGHAIDPPPMPSYKGKLTSAQIEDLVAYLESLRTPEN